MKKLTRDEMKAVNAGSGGGGGGGQVVCIFHATNPSCDKLCYDVDTPPYYYTSCAAAFSGPPGFSPSCGYYGYTQVTQCPGF